ncbi:uncharacterized protein LOC105389273 isoform X2 [Plutella xylostella]|uniref:uncharacterized protein LOC105389273 isoform X2 n=1 Tax=Plutella xylostella TaxID=51655 RepID=UPI0020323CB9|nr:uncharacterized protein LOC105389273 isoform X2 [Plutella xylostella]
MSQSRTRGTSAVRKSVTKASGDGRKEGKPHSQDKDKSTIPKNVRYELENALLGLCDVWFEEIKPHLVRNNIKLHVHGRADAGDGTRGAPACRHRDPGATSFKCELCRLLFSAAAGIDSAVSQSLAGAGTTLAGTTTPGETDATYQPREAHRPS